MRDDEETGAERDTFNSDQPDRDRETSQGARRPPAEKVPGATPAKAREARKEGPSRTPVG